MKAIKKHVASADAEAAVEREAETKPPRERGRPVEKGDPYPTLRRRVLFRDEQRG